MRTVEPRDVLPAILDKRAKGPPGPGLVGFQPFVCRSQLWRPGRGDNPDRFDLQWPALGPVTVDGAVRLLKRRLQRGVGIVIHGQAEILADEAHVHQSAAQHHFPGNDALGNNMLPGLIRQRRNPFTEPLADIRQRLQHLLLSEAFDHRMAETERTQQAGVLGHDDGADAQ